VLILDRRVGVPMPGRGLGGFPTGNFRAANVVLVFDKVDLELVAVTRDLHELNDSAALRRDPEVELQGDEHSESALLCLGGVLAQAGSNSVLLELLSH
jgi:hypothetical protein